MVGNKMWFVVISAVIAVLAALQPVSADTWRLEKGQDLKPVSAEGKDKYLLAVARVKELVDTGQYKAAEKALNKLKVDFPEIAGPDSNDLDAFIEAELLRCKGKYAKAIRSYDKLLDRFPESELCEVALDRQFAIATAFLAGRKKTVLKIFRIRGYAEGARIMENISEQADDTLIAKKAALAIVDSLERRKKFDRAYLEWFEISPLCPKDALLGMARCGHAAYRGPKYDESYLNSAKSFYENFKKQYSKDAGKFDVDKKLKQIREQRAYKQFSIGRYYQKTGNKQAANLYYGMVIRQWPDTKAKKMAEEEINREGTKAQKK